MASCAFVRAIATDKPLKANAAPPIIAAACPPSPLKTFNKAVSAFTAGSTTGIRALPKTSPKSRKDSPKESTEPAKPTAAA